MSFYLSEFIEKLQYMAVNALEVQSNHVPRDFVNARNCGAGGNIINNFGAQYWNGVFLPMS